MRRHKRLRKRVHGTHEQPRLAVFRSNQHIYAQLIDDVSKKTLASVSDLKLASKAKGKIETARAVGEALAHKAKEKKIAKVVFDRGGFKYHGRIRALAEGARKGGLKF